MVGAICLVETRWPYLVFFSFGLLTKQATLLLRFLKSVKLYLRLSDRSERNMRETPTDHRRSSRRARQSFSY